MSMNEQLRKQLNEKSLHDDGHKASEKFQKNADFDAQLEQNNALHAEMVIELNDQIDELKIVADKLRQTIKDMKAQETVYKKDI